MSLGKVLDDELNNLSVKIDKQKVPKHVAIIMDGNGRWATRKGLPRSFGHKQGVGVLKKILKAAKNLGCKVITVYAFSTENWTRPTKEVDFLINLFSEVLKNEIKEIHEESTKIKFTRSSCNLLLVIGLSSFPWLANDKVPVSSETTIQIHLSNLSVIPNAAKCLVPYLLIPCLERGSITPAEIILLPLTRTAPSCKGVSVAKRFIKRSVDNCASILVPEYKKSSGLKSLPKSTTIKAPLLF